MHPLARRVEGGGVVVFLADIETDEDVEPVLVHDSRYAEAAEAILDSLRLSYSTDAEGPATCLIRHGVYYKAGGRGVDEGNLWGDYFYLEALQRQSQPDWISYWHPHQPSPRGGRA